MKRTREPEPPAASTEPAPVSEDAAAASEPPPEISLAPPARRASPASAFWLAGILVLLVLVIAAIAAAPFWAPPVVALLPWGPAQQQAQDNTQIKELAARIDRVERLASRPDKTTEIAARLDRLEATDKDIQQQTTAAAAAVQKLDQHVAALEGKPAIAAAELGDLRQQLDKLNAATTALGIRIDAVQKSAAAQAGADPTDTGLVLMLLQIRDAIDAGRPFTAEYDAFAALANERPKIAAAAAPLAGAAQSGVASREVLRDQLVALAGTITNAKPQSAAADWQGEAWARMRSLVTIRRISGPGQSATESAVSAAQRDLAQGDLAAAIARLEALSGRGAEVAKPWLQMAHARLTTEEALRRTGQLLTAQLGAARKSGQP